MLKDIKSNRPKTWLKVVILRFKTWLVWHLTFFLAWQTAERVSVRLAARGSMHEHSHNPAHDPRYNGAAYYQATPIYHVPYPQEHPRLEQHAQHEQPQPQARHIPEKRSHPDTDEAPQPKAKRAKAKTNGASGMLLLLAAVIYCIDESPCFHILNTAASSKRGYNAKKRSEAAQIAAQNGIYHGVLSQSGDGFREKTQLITIAFAAQLMPTVSYTPMPNEKGKEKAADGDYHISLQTLSCFP